jgi:hypothetical protein
VHGPNFALPPAGITHWVPLNLGGIFFAHSPETLYKGLNTIMTRQDIELLNEAYSNSITPQQERQYSILRDLGWEYEDSVKGNIVVKRMDRGMESSTTLGYGVILKDGTFERLKKGQDPYDFIDEMLMGNQVKES